MTPACSSSLAHPFTIAYPIPAPSHYHRLVSDNRPIAEPVAPTPDPITAPPAPTLNALFFGDDGLRAGWSVLVFLILVVVVGIAGGALIAHFHLIPKTAVPQPGVQAIFTARFAAIDKLFEFLLFAIPAILMSLIERRPFTRYGLATRRMLPDFLTGLFWGFAALSLLVGALYLNHAIVFEGILLHSPTALIYAAKWGLVFFLVGIGEEFWFRGYLLYTVCRGVAGIARTMNPRAPRSHLIGFLVAASLFGVGLFMLAHLGNGGETFVGIFQVGLVGAVFSFSLYRTGSLWWAIGVHTAWDWAQSYFYGTADSGIIAVGHLLATHPLGSRLLSGGDDGPEGSVLGIPTLLLLAVVIHFTLPKRDYPLTPDQSPLPPGNLH